MCGDDTVGATDGRREEPVFPVGVDGEGEQIDDDVLCVPCEDEEEALLLVCLPCINPHIRSTWTTA